jgi:thioredoxin-dependent peroxiredoxin
VDNIGKRTEMLDMKLINPKKITVQINLLIMSLLATSWITANEPAMSILAPDFSLHDQHQQQHKLSDYRGQWLVLYFYPRDNTPGCTVEAGAFNSNLDKLKQFNTKVFGISVDDVESHKSFAKDNKLNFSLLSDEDYRVSRAYGVLKEIGPIKYAMRETFIIDPQGQIAHHFKDVDPNTHVPMVLAKLAALTATK